MANFFKDSIREFKHVVWPTSAETKRYFLVVLSVLVLFGIYLFVFGSIFAESVTWLRDVIQG